MKLILCIAFPLLLIAASDKGYIDMHGGKGDKLYDKGSNFSNFSSFPQDSLSSKPLTKKKEETLKTQDKNKKQQ